MDLDRNVARAVDHAVRKAVDELLARLPMTKLYYDTPEAAVYIGYSPEQLEIWRHQGKGPPYCQPNHRVRYKRSDLDDWMAKYRIMPEAK